MINIEEILALIDDDERSTTEDHAFRAFVNEVRGVHYFGDMDHEAIVAEFREHYEGVYESAGAYHEERAEEQDSGYQSLTQDMRNCIDWAAYAELQRVAGDYAYVLHPETGAGVFVFSE